MKSTTKKQTINEIKWELKNNNEISKDYLNILQQDPRKGVQSALRQYKKKQDKQRLVYENYLFMQTFENKCRDKGKQYIAGIDEVGRGPLAGPVVSAAVILPENPGLVGIDDSKK